MENLEIIIASIGMTVVFISFLQLVNANFLKERQVLRQYSTMMPAEKELEIMRYHNAWHKWKLYLCGFSILMQTMLILFVYVNPLAAVISAFISGFTIWFVGDIILNKLMNWKLFELGNKSGFDIVPFWVRAVGLGIAIGLMFTACNNQQKPVKTDIDFIPTKSAPIEMVTNFVTPYVVISEFAEPLRCENIKDAIYLINSKSKHNDGIYVDKGMVVYLDVTYLEK